MCTPRLPVVDWTDATADWNGLVRFAERRNLVSACVPSHFKRSLQQHSPMDHSLTHPNELWNFNILWNSSCGNNPKIFFYADKICNQQAFHISFAKLLERQNMKQNVHNWWKKNVSLKTYCSFCTSLFPTWHFHLHFSWVLYFIFGTGFEVPIVARIWKAIWVRTLEGKFESVFTSCLNEGSMFGWKTSAPMRDITRSHDTED